MTSDIGTRRQLSTRCIDVIGMERAVSDNPCKRLHVSNAAIVISVSDYSGRQDSLPGCKNDSNAIKVLLEKTGKFDHRLTLDGSEPSSVVKDKLAEFIKGLQGPPVDEVFFYYTGHGLFEDNEFFFLLSDFETNRRNSTSLCNSELDGLVRSLSPSMFVKIVDACQSGVSYIKGDNELEEYVKQHKSGFAKLYFLFSSSADQSSYASSRISRFTEGLIESITAHKSDRIRYQDLMSSVADRFQNNPRQTPFFVAQADYTEIFCHITEDLKSSLCAMLENGEASSPEPAKESVDLVARVRAKATEFASEAEAHASLEVLEVSLSEVGLAKELSELYTVEVIIHEDYPPRRKSIGEWLEEKLNDDVIFAKVTQKSEPFNKKVPRTISNIAAIAAGHFDEYQMVTEYRSVTSGYNLTTKLPFNHLSLDLSPRELSISPERLLIVPLLSRTTLYIFSSQESYEYAGWDTTRLEHASPWHLSVVPLKHTDKIRSTVLEIAEEFQQNVIENLRDQFETPVHGLSTASDGSSAADGKDTKVQKGKS